MLTIVICIYMLMFPHFGYDDMIYFSRYSLPGSIDIVEDILRDLLRFGIGVAGSLMVLLALNIVIRLKIINRRILSFLTTMGGMTFGLYVFQDFILMLLGPITKHLNSEYYILNSVISFVVIFAMASLMTMMAEKSKWASLLFLGKSKKKG